MCFNYKLTIQSHTNTHTHTHTAESIILNYIVYR